jgi:hypothetical protein
MEKGDPRTHDLPSTAGCYRVRMQLGLSNASFARGAKMMRRPLLWLVLFCAAFWLLIAIILYKAFLL